MRQGETPALTVALSDGHRMVCQEEKARREIVRNEGWADLLSTCTEAIGQSLRAALCARGGRRTLTYANMRLTSSSCELMQQGQSARRTRTSEGANWEAKLCPLSTVRGQSYAPCKLRLLAVLVLEDVADRVEQLAAMR